MAQHLTVVLYDYVPDILQRRDPHRPGHLALLQELHDAGRCRMAGAIGDPPHGAILVFTDRETAERFVAQDPYVAAGLVRRQRIEPWAVAVG